MSTSTNTIAYGSISGKSVPGKTIPSKSVPKKTYPLQNSPNNSPIKKSLNSPLLSLPDSQSLDSYITLPPCNHLTKVLNSTSRDAVLKTYSAAMKIVIMGIHSKDNSKQFYYTRKGEKINIKLLQKARSKILKCKDCDESFRKGESQSLNTNHNIFMCLQCTNIGCWAHGHAYSHAKSSGHLFGINPENGVLMCFKCGDLVSHPLLEHIRYTYFKKAGILYNPSILPYFQMEHDLKNRNLILNSSSIPSFKETTGLKGFINLGSTCFMSAVLQTIIHNPFIKNYYLSGAHSDCTKNSSNCLSCCVNEIYQDFFTNPAIGGYGLTKFIEAAWKVKRSLAGYSEQDAHEFWQFLVHQIHKNDTKNSKYLLSSNSTKENTPFIDLSGPENSNPNPFLINESISKSSNCDCIIHNTFAGSLESTLKCTVCGESRKIEDPMLDVSLEIQDKQNDEKVSLQDLHSCFRKYTNEEELDVLYECSSCKKKTKITKTLRLKKLPKVLSVQLKRFEHFGVSSKLDYHIDIPMVLDIKDYISDDIEDPHKLPNYQLFAIVCHLGNVNTGHYLAYVKHANGNWYKFDDATITRVTEADVKKVNGYMLVYCINEFI